jgi:hypothetical protein
MPNITPDPETGIGKWTDAEIAIALRAQDRDKRAKDNRSPQSPLFLDFRGASRLHASEPTRSERDTGLRTLMKQHRRGRGTSHRRSLFKTKTYRGTAGGRPWLKDGRGYSEC